MIGGRGTTRQVRSSFGGSQGGKNSGGDSGGGSCNDDAEDNVGVAVNENGSKARISSNASKQL